MGRLCRSRTQRLRQSLHFNVGTQKTLLAGADAQLSRSLSTTFKGSLPGTMLCDARSSARRVAVPDQPSETVPQGMAILGTENPASLSAGFLICPPRRKRDFTAINRVL